MEDESRNKWDEKELKRFIKEGIFRKCEQNVEHLALHPYWLSDPLQGLQQQLDSKLGKYMPKLGGYLVAYKNLKRDKSNLSMLNGDQPWIHVDVKAKFYIYQPKVGQILRGTIKSLGGTAAVCSVFKYFSVRVDPKADSQFDEWTYGTELEFELTSFTERNKEPELQAKCIRVLRFV